MLNDIGGGSKLTKIEALLNQTINEHFMLKHNDKTLAVPESDLNDLVNVRRELMELLFDAKKEQYDKNSELIYSRKNNEILNNLLEKQNSLQADMNHGVKDKINSDLMSENKVFQIRENDYRKKNYYIFIWKHITAYSILSLLTGLFVKTGHMNKKTGIILCIVWIIGLLFVLTINYYVFTKRNYIYFNKYNWKPKLESVNTSDCEA
tara:strand:- start:281 stop:901 length:621 start_codon:yes stop_codon:yes gene_type:complete